MTEISKPASAAQNTNLSDSTAKGTSSRSLEQTREALQKQLNDAIAKVKDTERPTLEAALVDLLRHKGHKFELKPDTPTTTKGIQEGLSMFVPGLHPLVRNVLTGGTMAYLLSRSFEEATTKAHDHHIPMNPLLSITIGNGKQFGVTVFRDHKDIGFVLGVKVVK